MRQIHFPESQEALAKARQHLVLEEFFIMQLAVSARRAELRHKPGAAHCGTGELMKRLHEALPFPLTGAQRRAVEEIRADLAGSRSMNRLLHGDVGSGKTLVALSAMLLCVESGHQAALMAPTQILAEQHYLNLRRLCDPLGIRIALRTGARKENAENLPLFELGGNGPTIGLGSDGSSQSRPHIFVGTHALLYENSGITNLGLAVIDEQHKFGVVQRARLHEQGRCAGRSGDDRDSHPANVDDDGVRRPRYFDVGRTAEGTGANCDGRTG
jgi:ATP-dependent DNA helicase RecG